MTEKFKFQISKTLKLKIKDLAILLHINNIHICKIYPPKNIRNRFKRLKISRID